MRIDLQLKGCDRTFQLKCSDPTSFSKWKLKLNHSISKSMGKRKNLAMNSYLSDISDIFEFWRFLRIPEILMVEQAELGDIIICLSNKKFAIKDADKNIDSVCLIVFLIDD